MFRMTAANGLVAGLALLVFVSAAEHKSYPLALLGPLAFVCVQRWVPSCRPVFAKPLCPWNWALGVFFLQIVGMPLLLLYCGAAVGVLPYLPSSATINGAMAINVIAFIAFAWSYRSCSRHKPDGEHAPLVRQHEQLLQTGGTRFALLYIFAGCLGLFLTFGSIAGISDYFRDPIAARQLLTDMSSTVRGVAGVVLRPFLGFAVVILWCRWLDARTPSRSVLVTGLVTLLFVSALTLTNLTLAYNRGAVLVPLVAMFAVVLQKANKSSITAVAVAAVLVLVFAPALALYRSGSLTTEAAENAGLQDIVLETIDPVDYIQMYGSAPQYLGYLLEATRWGASPRWGRVVVCSILSPVPIVGKVVRSGSGTSLYNHLIYGTSEIQDQVVPFQGELFLDFHITGVLAGYVLLGWMVHKLQGRFEQSSSSLELYIWQYAAVWMSFLIIGSISVVSQILIYFFWPIYLYFGWKGITLSFPSPPARYRRLGHA